MSVAGHAIPELDAKGLRKFGLTTGVIFCVLFGLIIPFIRGVEIPPWPYVVAAFFWVPALLFPLGLKAVYRGWMTLGGVLGAINTRIILGVFFFGVVLPMGLIMRLVGRDPMARKVDKSASSYRVPSRERAAKSMEGPY